MYVSEVPPVPLSCSFSQWVLGTFTTSDHIAAKISHGC